MRKENSNVAIVKIPYHLNSRVNKSCELFDRDFKDDIIEEFESHERKLSSRSCGAYYGQFDDYYNRDYNAYSGLPFDDAYDDYFEDDLPPMYSNKRMKRDKRSKRNEKLLGDFFPNLGKGKNKRSTKNIGKGKNKRKLSDDNSSIDSMEKWIYFYDDYEDMHKVEEFHTFGEFKNFLANNGINMSDVEKELIMYWEVSHVTLNPVDKAAGILNIVADSSQSKLYETCADIEYSHQISYSNKRSDLPF